MGRLVSRLLWVSHRVLWSVWAVVWVGGGLVRALVQVVSDRVGGLVGRGGLRGQYGLWLGALVTLGPLLTPNTAPRLVFANRGSFIYTRFLDSAWGWTCLLLVGFLLPAWLLGRGRGLGLGLSWALAVALRLGLATGLQLACLWGFGLLRDVTGSCFAQAEGGLLLIPEAGGQGACLGLPGREWRGYTLSGPCFLLTYASLVLLEELAPARALMGRPGPPHLDQAQAQASPKAQASPWQQDSPFEQAPPWAQASPQPQACPRAQPQASTSLRLLFLLAASLLPLWSFLLLLSTIFFHTYTQKVAAAAVAQLCWRLTYGLWFRWAWSPGMPGAGNPGPHPLHRPPACVCGRAWDPARETRFYRE